ncbi:MAG TPA: DNA polymerase II, partial [Verrucomicrobiales bacterium]|nr:DNA polymerase II [Verrucomicrobiales bacterium]
GLFMGRFDWGAIHPFPLQSTEDRDQGDAFLERLSTFLHEKVDPDEIDRTGEIPPDVIEELARMGAFGIKVPPAYGGLGLSQTNYCRAATLLGSWCANLAALLSAHQSIGVPQPLILFGTEEQKRRYLPRVAKGEISAFALTESSVGSDPAKMETHAEPTADGSAFVLNGEKLWCTNGTKAGVIVVMARTPSMMVNGRPRNQITAFVVETGWPGVEIVHRCRFMGLKALYNAVIRFKDVRVPRENILLGEGKGLRVALVTLNTGRLTLPAACAGLAKRCLDISRRWASSREQWGQPIGRHAAIADKLARMATAIFAMESMAFAAASQVDRDKKADIRIEAAMAKMWGSEAAWEIINEAMQIRGGRGYETVESLRARGEEPVPVERFLRDARINTIFEGSSEIMRLFLAREALDPHLKVAAPVLDSRLPLGKRIVPALQAGLLYAGWYLRLLLPTGPGPRVNPLLRPHLKYARRTSRRLARTLFHSMLRHGPKLERQQLLLGRLVEIGTELWLMSTSLSRAQTLLDRGEAGDDLLTLVDCLCHQARTRIETGFLAHRRNADRCGYRLSRGLLGGRIKTVPDRA